MTTGGSHTNSWLLLHGFGGGAESWAKLQRLLDAGRTCAPPLLGHERRSDSGALLPVVPNDSSEESLFMDEVGRLAGLATSSLGKPFSVCGYSLGGRLALGMAAAEPSCVERLVLVGANPGLEAQEEREKRAEADERWARMIELDGARHFFGEWLKQGLFASQGRLPEETLAAQNDVRESLRPEGLALAMRHLSLSRMPNLRPSLTRISCPVDLVVGERDPKFFALAESMAELIPRCRITGVPGVGHNVLLEAPHALAEVLGRKGPA